MVRTKAEPYYFASYPYFEEDKQRKMIAEITLADIQKIREKLLSQATGLKVLSVGNLSDQQVKDLSKEVTKVIQNKNTALAKYRYLDINQSSRKLNVVKNVPNEDNALSIAFMAKDYAEMDSYVRALFLKDVISRWYFDDLRTNKQLGYVVSKSTDAAVLSGFENIENIENLQKEFQLKFYE